LQPYILQESLTIGSWGEQIPNTDFPAELAARFPPIVGVCVNIWFRADDDNGNGDDGNGDDGNGDDGNGDDGSGDNGNGDDGNGDDGNGDDCKCCDVPVKTIDWLDLSLRWHVAYIVAASPNPQPREDVLYKDSV